MKRLQDPAPKDPPTNGLPQGWTAYEECCFFDNMTLGRDVQIGSAQDGNSYMRLDLGGRSVATMNQPRAWRCCFGNYRSFSSAVGQQPETFSTPSGSMLPYKPPEWVSQRQICAR